MLVSEFLILSHASPSRSLSPSAVSTWVCVLPHYTLCCFIVVEGLSLKAAPTRAPTHSINTAIAFTDTDRYQQLISLPLRLPACSPIIMMFPSAVQGHMPFVEKYKQEQIKKVIEKNRSRHHSGPERCAAAVQRGGVSQRNTHSMPILWQSVYSGQRPKFRSMPTLDDSQLAHLPHRDSKDSKSLLSSLKKFFSSKRDMVDSKSLANGGATGAVIVGNSARLYTSKSSNKKPADVDCDVTSGSVRSPKRQRMRTISNISAVMETIEEDNEISASVDQLTDGSGSSCGTPTHLTPVPEATGLFYSCGDLSNHTDSSSSHHSSAELICTA